MVATGTWGWKAVALFALALLPALWLLYRVAFDAPFYFDTAAHLENKSNLHLASLTWRSLSDAARIDFDKTIYRPLAQLSLALTHYGFGLVPRPYRVGNLLIHWLASLAVVILGIAVLRTPRVRFAHPEVSSRAVPIALAAAAVWSLHPVQTNVATYVIQRMAGLCGLFSFLSVASYLRCRSTESGWSWPWLTASGISLLLALGSKENAVTLLPVLLVAELTVLEPPSSRWARKRWLGTGLAVLAIAAVGAWLGLGPLLRTIDYSQRPFTLGERLLTEARIQGDYARVLLVPDPDRLVLAPDVTVSHGLFAPPTTALAIFVIAGLLCLAWAIRRKRPLASFSILWFFATQLAEGTVIPLELYYEHRLYVPSALLFLWLMSVAFWALRHRWTLRFAVPCILVLVLGWEARGTFERNLVWSDPIAFWADAAAKFPRSARALTNLGSVLLAAKRYGEAERVLKSTLEMKEVKAWLVHINLAEVAYRRGRIEDAKNHLLDSLRLVRRTNWKAPRYLAMLAIRSGDLDEASQYLDMALAQKPSDAETWRLYGLIYMRRGNLAQAEEALLTAVRYDERYAETWNTLGAVYYKKRDFSKAADCFERAALCDRNNRSYQKNLERARAFLSEAR
jgi:Flp pilus assembly protein TadD